MINVGFGASAIDVPPGTPMAGFAARTAGSLGVMDPTSARALATDGFALVVVDVCALHEDTCTEIRRRLGGIVADCIVAATHTHAGPCCARGRLGPDEPEIEQAIVDACVAAVTQAENSLQPCTLRTGQVIGLGIAHNRRDGRPIDPPLTILEARTADGGIAGRLVEFACHPVVMDGANRLISGDYPAFMRAWLDADGGVTVFACGCAGDVNTGHSAEASYTPGNDPTRSPQAAERIGERLAGAVATADLRAVRGTRTVMASVPVRLEMKLPSRDQIEAQLRDWTQQREAADPGTSALLKAWADWAEAQLAAPTRTDHWDGRVSAARLGEVLLIACPGEPFLEVAHHITGALTAGDVCGVVPVGYADGVPGYLPTEDEYPRGGYEVEDAFRYYSMPGPFARGSAERLESAAQQAARKVSNGQ